MPYLYLVFSGPADGKDTEYNTWYDKIHLPDLLRVPGVEKSRRFRAVSAGLDTEAAPYLAIYQVTDPELAFNIVAKRAGTPELSISPALDGSSVKSHSMEIVEGTFHEHADTYLLALAEHGTPSAGLAGPGIAVLKPGARQARPGPQPAWGVLAAISSPEASDEIAAILSGIKATTAVIATASGPLVSAETA